MPNTGCGYPINDSEWCCGQSSAAAPSLPILCPACQRGRAMLASVGLGLNAFELSTLREAMIADGYCEGCLDAKATTTGPQLCATCRADLDRDLGAEETIDDGDPGSRCGSGCGYCGRCGGA